MKKNKREQKKLMVQIIAIILVISMLISFAMPFLGLLA